MTWLIVVKRAGQPSPSDLAMSPLGTLPDSYGKCPDESDCSGTLPTTPKRQNSFIIPHGIC